MGVKVTRYENEDDESLLRRFRRQVNDASVLAECKKREFYMSPAEKRKAKHELHEDKLRKEKAALRRPHTFHNNSNGFVKKV